MRKITPEPGLQQKYDILLKALVAVFTQDHEPGCKLTCIPVAECPFCPDHRTIVKMALCKALGKKTARKLLGSSFDWIKPL